MKAAIPIPPQSTPGSDPFESPISIDHRVSWFSRCAIELLRIGPPSRPRARHFIENQSLLATPPNPLLLVALARLIASARSILDLSNTACNADISDGADTSSTRVMSSLPPLIVTTPAEVSFPFLIMAMIGSEYPSLDPMRKKKRSVALSGCFLSNGGPAVFRVGAHSPTICSRSACAC